LQQGKGKDLKLCWAIRSAECFRTGDVGTILKRRAASPATLTLAFLEKERRERKGEEVAVELREGKGVLFFEVFSVH